MSRCNHTAYDSCLHGEECAQCLRERVGGSFAASTLLAEFEAALTILKRIRQRPVQEWSDRTNYEFLEDVMLDLEDIIDSEQRNSIPSGTTATGDGQDFGL